jgi:hypothetical protein
LGGAVVCPDPVSARNVTKEVAVGRTTVGDRIRAGVGRRRERGAHVGKIWVTTCWPTGTDTEKGQAGE